MSGASMSYCSETTASASSSDTGAGSADDSEGRWLRLTTRQNQIGPSARSAIVSAVHAGHQTLGNNSAGKTSLQRNRDSSEASTSSSETKVDGDQAAGDHQAPGKRLKTRHEPGDSPDGHILEAVAKKKDPTSHRLIEKRRRDRMNNCLSDLSKLIPTHYLKKGRGRVEKTEIIETAIRYMKELHEFKDMDSKKASVQQPAAPSYALQQVNAAPNLQQQALPALATALWPAQETPLSLTSHSLQNPAIVQLHHNHQLRQRQSGPAAQGHQAQQATHQSQQQPQQQAPSVRTYHQRPARKKSNFATAASASAVAMSRAQSASKQGNRCVSLGSKGSSASGSSSSLESSSSSSPPSGNERSSSTNSTDSSSSGGGDGDVANDLTSVATSLRGSVSLGELSDVAMAASCMPLIQSMRRVVAAVEVVAIAMKTVTEQVASVLEAKSEERLSSLTDNRHLAKGSDSAQSANQPHLQQQQQQQQQQLSQNQNQFQNSNQNQNQKKNIPPQNSMRDSSSSYTLYASSTKSPMSDKNGTNIPTNQSTAINGAQNFNHNQTKSEATNHSNHANGKASYPRPPIKLSLKRYEYCKQESRPAATTAATATVSEERR